MMLDKYTGELISLRPPAAERNNPAVTAGLL